MALRILTLLRNLVDFNIVNTAAGNTAVAFMFLYMITFGASIAALPWTYQNEVSPINARGRGTALSTSINWFVNFWLGLYIPQALNVASWKLYYVFGAINVSISVVTFLFYPETCKRSLEEMDLLFTPNRRKLVEKDRCWNMDWKVVLQQQRSWNLPWL